MTRLRFVSQKKNARRSEGKVPDITQQKVQITFTVRETYVKRT